MDPEKRKTQEQQFLAAEILPLHSGQMNAGPKAAEAGTALAPEPQQRKRRLGLFIWAKILVACFALRFAYLHLTLPTGHGHICHYLAKPNSGIYWKSCGEDYGDEFQCANVTVPLDYHNASDTRTYSVGVTRLLASDKENRKGSVFLNPGGPGGSGTRQAKHGQSYAKVLKNQFDLIGIDPRGIGESNPYVSCFETQLDAEAFAVASHQLSFDLPANTTAFPYLREDVLRQIGLFTANTVSVARRCLERSGEILPYIGTEFVIRDIDTIAKLIDDEPINFWGFSYGTVVGQYMVKVLPPERLGRIVIDGVVNAAIWNEHATSIWDQGLQDIDNVLFSFASSCLAAGANCSLNADSTITSTSSLMAKIDHLMDMLYERPVPVFGLDIPAVATASSLRSLLFRDMYGIRSWPQLADQLSDAFKGDFTQVVNATQPRVNPDSAGRPDDSSFSTYPIICADALQYPKPSFHPAPTDEDLVDHLFGNLKRYSHRFGEAHFTLGLCHLWVEAGLPPSRSRYAGTFELEDDTLTTPMLILSNTYDPVTPLQHAMAANQRMGNNARLIQQIGGYGHCAIGHVSYCTALATRQYFLDGKVPAEKHTACTVDQVPFQPFEPSGALVGGDDELMGAWIKLEKDTQRWA